MLLGGHIGIYYTLTGINTAIICVIYGKMKFASFYLSSPFAFYLMQFPYK